MPHDEPDLLRLDGFEAETPQVEEQFWQHIAGEQDMLTVLAEHHTDDARHSFYVLHNGAVTWGIPGEPQIVALHLQRDIAARTFRFEHAELPLPAMAQSWLIARGCPKEAIRLPDGMGTRPADEATRALQERLMTDGDHFALLTSYTDDTSARPETMVVLRALDERAPLPFRILLEEADLDAGTHTLREGGFATFEAATEWWENHYSGDAAALPTAPPLARRSPVPASPARPAPTAPPRGRSR
ncbi:hypothetical protein [Streptomyces albireticuli]|uniref:Uncharacterized protein n=1 Tax=Streptomyces albireticuli TaxID=1940 RepID=A0A2A2DA64_9ACTN|nr:hypothetical protein [Streptomyces albireticuli]MCD9193384.1 hypothetical protein [Streptomyces albireticuli]PAU48404.1 hypothetical protein CK936_13505 [Streptomyces albireticuli]